MGIFDKLFRNRFSEHQWIRFGRASDEVKTQEQIQIWDQAMIAYEEGRFADSLENVLAYLVIPGLDNVKFSRNQNLISFELYQGSKLILGTIDGQWFEAKSRLAQAHEFGIGILRKLLEGGLDLQFSRYTIDKENYICLVFDGFLDESSPYKLYYGLKELAIRADKMDDLLMDEFENLIAVDDTHVSNYSSAVIQVKLDLFRKLVAQALDPKAIGNLDGERYPGAWTYIYLSALYKLDYLICAEGKSMELVEKAHQFYFTQTDVDLFIKTDKLRETLQILQAIKDEKLVKEFYLVHHTFGLKSAVPFITIAEFITNEMNALDWYVSNHHQNISIAICHYIAGYLLFSFCLPEPVNELLHFYFICDEGEYFSNLEIESYSLKTDSDYIKYESKLQAHVKKILTKHQKKYTELNTDFELQAKSKYEFCYSILSMIRDLNL